jgi:DNA-binding response OmpR family regulator
MEQRTRPGHILVVDDEPLVREVVGAYLERDGHTVEAVADGDAALAAVADHVPDLIILDVMLPGIDGLSLLRQIRTTSRVPVLMLTARADETDRVLGLELGADDYVVKPFSPREVAARAKTILRRVRGGDVAPVSEQMEFGSLFIDPTSREARLAGRLLDLTRREFDLLAFLASAPRQVFSREQLLRMVWDSSQDWQDPATVTVHVRRLRAKLGDDPSRPRWIITVRGIGYRFEP